jgi:hypothetical protein
MSVDEARRLLLHDAAREAWGADAALVLMEMLPPTGWADVAPKHDLEELEARLEARLGSRLGGRIDAVEAQIEILRFDVTAQIADGQRRMMQWTVTTMIAMTGVFAAITRFT